MLGAIQHDVDVNYNSFMLNEVQIMLKIIDKPPHNNRYFK